jgi:hypothetical protein
MRTSNSSSTSDAQITDQIKVLNADFAIANMTFELSGTTRTLNPDWFTIPGIDGNVQTEMKKSLRKGGKGDLNIYTVG